MAFHTGKNEGLRIQMVALLPRLRRFARSLAGDPDRADELVQQTCERALDRLHQWREGTRLDSWLYRILYTRWVDRIRRVNAHAAKLKLYAIANDVETAGHRRTGGLVDLMDLKSSLSAIPAEHRAAISLVCIEGFSYAEAADVLNVPPGTVASRVARARAMLAQRMDQKAPQVIPLAANAPNEVKR